MAAKQMKVRFQATGGKKKTRTISIEWDRGGETEDQIAEALRYYEIEFAYSRISGTLMLGEDMPNQKNFDERTTFEATFDIQKVGYNAAKEIFSTTLSFGRKDVTPTQLDKFSYQEGWLVIDKLDEIPKPAKKEKENPAQAQLWTAVPIAALGLDNKLVEEIFKQNVKSVGRMVSIIKGEDRKYASLDKLDGVTKARAKTIRGKIDTFFEGRPENNPLIEA